MKKEFISELYQANKNSTVYLDKKRIEDFIDIVFRFLFQLEDRKYHSESAIQLRIEELKAEFNSILCNILNDKEEAKSIADNFGNALPLIYKALLKDAHYILDSDPAATCLEEVFIAYPGFYAIAVYRFAHQLQKQKVALLPRIWTEYAHSKTGIDIHPAAHIGAPFFIDHGTGIVIGETTVIGSNVKIYQGVTLGAVSVSKKKKNQRRHPQIEDHVVIYSNATILGGDTIIGHHSVIGGNVWLTKSVEPHSLVFHEAQVVIKDKNSDPETIHIHI
ncbi:MAG: serine O-acetyltransferase [Balneolaceae bacterium]